jgi:hypothetical protein
MPYTTYGLLKTIRSHQISSPSVRASLETGRPNACNLCHLDKTLAWTAEYLNQWYGTAKPALGLADSDEQSVAASLLWLLRGDAGQRAIVAQSMGWPAAQQASGTRLARAARIFALVARRSVRRGALHHVAIAPHAPAFRDLAYDYVAPPPSVRTWVRAMETWRRTRDEGELARQRGAPDQP